jgi:hypothetical protein
VQQHQVQQQVQQQVQEQLELDNVSWSSSSSS